LASQVQEEFYQHLEKMVAYLDSFIVTGSDQELFIASYLHGHFDLAVVQAEQAQGVSIKTRFDVLFSQLSRQLDSAFKNNELTDADQKQVTELVTTLSELA